ncbi:uncharacterized protein LOC111116687 [Crassostrea virginica]
MTCHYTGVLFFGLIFGLVIAKCEREEECEFEKLKRNILIFAVAIFGFAVVLMICSYIVYKLRSRTRGAEIGSIDSNAPSPRSDSIGMTE